MAQLKRRNVSDELWERIETLIPPPPGRAEGCDYERKPGGGRKPMPARQAFEAIVYVLRTKTQWKALPRRFGSPSAVHSRFKLWERSGLFAAIWQAGLAEHDGMAGIAWEWEIAETTRISPQIAENDPRNPTDGEKAPQAWNIHQRSWRPAGIRRRHRERPQ